MFGRASGQTKTETPQTLINQAAIQGIDFESQLPRALAGSQMSQRAASEQRASITPHRRQMRDNKFRKHGAENATLEWSQVDL